MKRVTASKPPQGGLNGLKTVAAVLNFDWEGGNLKQLEKLKADLGGFYWLVVIERVLKDRGKATMVETN